MPLDDSNPYAHLVPSAGTAPKVSADNPYSSLVPKPSSETLRPAVGDLPVPDPGTVIAPAVNLLVADPIRSLAADVVGVARAGLPTSPESREKFWKERERSLAESERYARLPEGEGAKTVEKVITAPMSWIGSGVQALSNAWGMQPIGPFAQMGADVLPFAGARMVAPKVATKLAAEASATPLTEIASALADNSASGVEQSVMRLYHRAIRPSVSGRQTAGQMTAYDQNAWQAMSSIAGNKANIKYTDGAGETVGHAPQSLLQFSDAIDQTKDAVFQKYNPMVEQATASGARVDFNPIIAELDKVAASDVVGIHEPSLAARAKATADAMRQKGAYTPVEAQEAIRHLNNKLKAYYRNPTADGASAAGIEAMEANILRQQLDKTVEQFVGPGYGDFKREYGALRSIEKDVVHRAAMDTRAAQGGGLTGALFNVASADQVIRGVIEFSPGSVGRGAALLAIKEGIRHFRDPNRMVKRMFDKVEQLQGEAPSPSSSLPPVINTGPQPPRPTGREYEMYGGPLSPSIQGGTATEAMGLAPRGVVRVDHDPFIMPPGGGRVQ